MYRRPANLCATGAVCGRQVVLDQGAAALQQRLHYSLQHTTLLSTTAADLTADRVSADRVSTHHKVVQLCTTAPGNDARTLYCACPTPGVPRVGHQVVGSCPHHQLVC